jgi:divalent metal cation (Fe/Co/Zn/Cd) transporter
VYLSAVILAGLAANAAFGWWWAHPVAALGVVAFLVRKAARCPRPSTLTTAADDHTNDSQT